MIIFKWIGKAVKWVVILYLCLIPLIFIQKYFEAGEHGFSSTFDYMDAEKLGIKTGTEYAEYLNKTKAEQVLVKQAAEEKNRQIEAQKAEKRRISEAEELRKKDLPETNLAEIIGNNYKGFERVEGDWIVKTIERHYWTPENLLGGAGMEMEKIGTWMAKNPVKRYPENDLHYKVFAETTDKYANKHVLHAFTIVWRGSDLKRMNWKNATHYDILDLAKSVEIRAIGRTTARKYCNKRSMFTPVFCTKF